MNDTQQKEAAKQFASYWKGKGYEKGESQAFWLSRSCQVLLGKIKRMNRVAGVWRKL